MVGEPGQTDVILVLGSHRALCGAELKVKYCFCSFSTSGSAHASRSKWPIVK